MAVFQRRLASFLFVGLLSAVLLCSESSAELASPREAALVCRNWLSRVVHENGSWAGETMPEVLDATELLAEQGAVLAYCFAVSPTGYVLVPVLKELPPVKAYSEESSFDAGETHGFVQLVRERLTLQFDYFAELYGNLGAAQAERGDDPFGPLHRRNWDRLLVSPTEMESSLRAGEWSPVRDAGPLLTTSWHQFAPFNGFCPDGDGGRCIVGCVATALAQILNYHEWPDAGFGEHSYYWGGDHSCGGSTPGETLSAVFRDSYDWAAMPDGRADSGLSGGLGGRDDDAVAELCYEIGVAVEMYYGHCSSGAHRVVDPLRVYFRYDDDMTWQNGSAYSSDDWFALIQEEIDQARPIFYTYPTHALVCDGWRVDSDEKQIHLNYGGGGAHTAWYVLDDIFGNPTDHRAENMVTGIFPDPAIVLSADGAGDYPTVQDAIQAATVGDVIKLQGGVYAGPGNRDIDFLGKAVTVRSQYRDPQTCIIDAGGSEPDPHRGVVFRSSEPSAAVLEDLWVTGGWTADAGGGVSCVDASPTIVGCVIEGNTAASGGGGISCAGAPPSSGAPVMTNCTVFGNTGGGVLVDGCEVVLENTLIVANTDAPAVACVGAGEPVLTCCDIYGNPEGDWVGCIESQLGVNGNISAGPVFCAPWDGILTLSAPSVCLPENNPCGVLVGAMGEGCEDYLVYPDGSGYFPTIQAAIDSMADNRPGYADWSIVLADGVYTGPGNWDIVCSKSVSIRSASRIAANCVVDCGDGSGEPHRGFWFHGAGSGISVLDTISIANAAVPSGDGGAVRCSDDTIVWIRGCRLSDNGALRGGAVAVDSSSVVSIISCELSANSASQGGAVYCADSSSVYLWRSTLAHNSAEEGSGVHVSDATIDVAADIIAFGADGEAVWCEDASLSCVCTDIYGNAGGDWVGCLDAFLGIDGNVSADPLFCDPSAGDYTIAEESPCLDTDICISDQMGAYGVGCESPGGDDGPETPPARLHLSQNYPNPFSPGTDFTLELPVSGRVRLIIYDVSGRVVATPIDGSKPPGTFTARWDGRDRTGSRVAGGVYFARLEQGGGSDVRKIVIVK